MRVPTPSQPTAQPPYRHTGAAGLTWEDSPSRPAAQSLDLRSMRLLERDGRILTLVARFGQLTTNHVNDLVFYESKSRTPCERALKRLVADGLLEHVPQRHPGGRLGGSPLNVFQLGAEGWRLFFEGRRKFSRVIRAHSLAIADVYVAIKQGEREGWLEVLDYATEPDSHVDVAGADLRPDLYVELGLREKRQRVVLWLEVDLGTERQKQIAEKIERYRFAYEHSDQYQGDVFPSIVFLALDDERVRELNQILRRAKNTPGGLIQVQRVESFPLSLR